MTAGATAGFKNMGTANRRIAKGKGMDFFLLPRRCATPRVFQLRYSVYYLISALVVFPFRAPYGEGMFCRKKSR